MPNTRWPTSVATAVLDEPRVSGVAETSRNPPNQIETSVCGAQEQAARVDVIAPLSNSATTGRPSTRPNTLGSALHSLHRAPSPNWRKSFSQNNFCLISEARCATKCEKCGLVPASPSIEAAAADQKHDDDDDEKSCHIHDSVSFGRTVGNLISPTSG